MGDRSLEARGRRAAGRGLRRWERLALAALCALALPLQALARQTGQGLALKANRLDAQLRQLAAGSGVGILFSPDLVGERRGPALDGAASLEAALTRLLQGSGLGFRRTAAGTIIIVPQAETGAAYAVPEILVVGKRTQNQDIRRTQNDIQPYRVFGARDIEASLSNDLGGFLRTRLTSTAARPQITSSSPSSPNSNRSEVNLRGLGSDQTLVLIDGARMPGLPSPTGSLSLLQPDLNGAPLFAIDRIETLTSTAGGVYGPGATGGIVNVILKRDYRGADLKVTVGMADRGDASYRRIDGRLGFTPNHGRTDVMLVVSRTASAPLAAGRRDFAAKARALNIAKARDFLVANPFPPSDGIIIKGPLTLKPDFGGGGVPGAYTYLPADYAGAPNDLIAVLTRNAGTIPSNLSPDGNGTRQSLVSGARTTSLLANVHHHFSPAVEAFVDFIGYSNEGYGVTGANPVTVVFPSSSISPFSQVVTINFPLPGFDGISRDRLTSWRLSNGVILRLPRAWKAELSYNLGGVIDRVSSSRFELGNGYFNAINYGEPGFPGGPLLDPFGPTAKFLDDLQAYKVAAQDSNERRSVFRDASVRLAGPVLQTRAGPAFLTLLLERRHEATPTGLVRVAAGSFTSSAPYSQTVASAYGEFRAPLLSRDVAVAPLRGLEVSLAVRHDRTTATVPDIASLRTLDEPYVIKARPRRDTTAFTAGLRAFPSTALMVRASLATGALPPTTQDYAQESTAPTLTLRDPRRGGVPVRTQFTILSGGSLNAKPERARSIGVGAVLHPDDPRRLRVSLDLIHIEKRDEISDYGLSYGFFLANEALFPDRIVRAPLTAADRAKGYTAGLITRIDASALNVGRTTIDTLDLAVDYARDIGDEHVIDAYAQATWQPRLKRRLTIGMPAVDYTGYTDGDLEWRAVAGLGWRHGAFSADLSGQIYAGYRAVDALNPSNQVVLKAPPQAYFDASLSYRFRGTETGRGLGMRLGVANILDHAPPVVINTPQGHSPYGDARRRRLELSLAKRF